MNYPKIVKSTKIAVSIFYMDWCPHCQRMKPVFDKVRDDLAEHINVFTINCEAHPDVADEVEVRAYPTIVIYLHGKEVTRLTGDQTVESIESAITKIQQAADK